MLLTLDKQGPLYAQLYRVLRSQILAGRLSPGARVPATRALAMELGVSRNVVMLAYEQLLAEGYLLARTGAGTFVASDLPQKFTTPITTTGITRALRQMPVQLSAYVRRLERDATVDYLTLQNALLRARYVDAPSDAAPRLTRLVPRMKSPAHRATLLLECARLGAHLHGLAADQWAARHGDAGMTANDLLDGIPDALQAVRAGQ